MTQVRHRAILRDPLSFCNSTYEDPLVNYEIGTRFDNHFINSVFNLISPDTLLFDYFVLRNG